MEEIKTRKRPGPKPGTARAKHGGQALIRLYGHEHMAEMGRRGGEKTTERYGREYYQRIGAAGGATTKVKHGHDYYSRIGKMGVAKREANKAARRKELKELIAATKRLNRAATEVKGKVATNAALAKVAALAERGL